MVKKKAADEDSIDLTRIEDLSEFLHQEDSDLDSVFETFSPNSAPFNNDGPTSPGLDLSSLEEDSPPDLPLEEENNFEASSLDEVSFEMDSVDSSDEFLENNDNSSDLEVESPFESLSDLDSSFEEASFDSENIFENEPLTEDLEEDISTNTTLDHPIYNEAPINHPPENFNDIKSFAQNFSYGKISPGGGNPPYTIILRHIKFKEDADNILDLLREFGLVNDSNEKDHLRALELGSLIIPQISEYTAIILAHKFRRFDLDLQVGLSDEVHPSKSGDINPKGLIKKDNLKQNKSEAFKLSEKDLSINDIIVSTTSNLPGYQVESFIGVHSTFTIVEESELEKLQYVQKKEREKSEIFDYAVNEDESDLTSAKAFKDYQYSFELLYEDLTNQLKQKAFTQNSNALLGLNFQLSPLQFERSQNRINAYQITCSATLAVVSKENS